MMRLPILSIHPKKGDSEISKKQIRLASIIKDYNGADIILDFNAENVLIGIEILL